MNTKNRIEITVTKILLPLEVFVEGRILTGFLLIGAIELIKI